MSLIFTVLVGGGLGAALGYFGKCSSGGCPLTANPWRGAIYGIVLGLWFHTALARKNYQSAPESSANVRLVSETQFASEVTQTAGPVVVDFFATWCGPCKALGPMLNELAGPLTNKIKFLKVDIDESGQLAEQFHVEGVPTLVFFRNAKEIDRLVGLPAQRTLKQKLDALASTGQVTAARK